MSEAVTPSELPETISIAEQAQASGRQILPPGADPEIDALREHCRGFIAAMPGDPKAHGIIMAKTKLEELIFWLRAAKRSVGRGAS